MEWSLIEAVVYQGAVWRKSVEPKAFITMDTQTVLIF